MENDLTPHQSLDLIASMINEAKGNVSKSSFYFLTWGWVIALCNFGMYLMFAFSPYPSYAPWVWILILPAWIMTMIYGRNQGRESKVTTHLDRINMWLWISMAITILPVWIFGAKINWMVNAIVLMPAGAATFVSGIIIRYRPLIIGGIVFWVAGVLCYLVSPLNQLLVGGLATVCGYLIPGYMLRYQKEKNA